ncbi:transcription factor IIIB 90 kDa subunit isoform X2 [Leptidea sinapis]|nr:transcription factor IIIB 90 kDa subunit isoform X2 [Leptidea sinapis]
MALSRHLTIGRPAAQTQAACVYMTCRTEGTPHLLIDISDALQICCYQLGRAYFKLSRALCINIPPTDPCLYIIRFSSQLQFEEKQHEVSMTALRLVQRMKRDSIHSGRRPSGICGAALLIAARLHDFSRTPADVVRIVKVHESTLRKRLMEFGDTPSSALTLDEFMTVDLEEEQDPPAFRAARKKDKERLQKLLEEEDGEKELTELQKEIELHLDSETKIKRRKYFTPKKGLDFDEESAEATRFATEESINVIGSIAIENEPCSNFTDLDKEKLEKGLGPEIAVIGLGPSDDKPDMFLKPELKWQQVKDLHNPDELVMSDKDEDYIDSLIMSDDETIQKSKLWKNVNAHYLKEQKIKDELRARDRDEGKDKKKKVRGAYRKKVNCNAATAGEALGKMLAEKKISAKINYDILKSLDEPGTSVPVDVKSKIEDIAATPIISTPTEAVSYSPAPKKRKKKETANLNIVTTDPVPPSPSQARTTPVTPATPSQEPATPNPPATPSQKDAELEEDEDDLDADVTEAENEFSLAAMLQNEQEDDYYGYEEY